MWLKEKLTEIPGEIPHEEPNDQNHPPRRVGVSPNRYYQVNVSGSIT